MDITKTRPLACKLSEQMLYPIQRFILFISFFLFILASTANAQVAVPQGKIAFATFPEGTMGYDAAQVKVAPSGTETNIKDELRHGRLKRVLAGVMDLKEGKVGEIVGKFSGKETNWVWILREGRLPKNINAETVPVDGGAITTLDYRNMKNAARLSIARTIIHELVHAYLSLYFRYDALAASKEYPQMVEAWQGSHQPDLNEVHHAEMAVSLVDDIALAVEEYGRSIGQSVEAWVYTSLAWGGLDFQSNEQLTKESKGRIERMLEGGQFCTLTFRNILTNSKTVQ